MNQTTFTVLLVEDEPATANRQQKMLKELAPEATILATLDSIESTVDFLKNHAAPDLILMDIQLADGISFEIFKQVEVGSPLIFLTAYDQFALKAFKVNSVDYLLKPLKKSELEAALDKFRRSRQTAPSFDWTKLADLMQQTESKKLNRMMVKVGSQIKSFEVENVAYFYIEDKIVFAMLHDGSRYTLDNSLEQLDEQLDKQQFFRINRSMIISFKAIDKLYTYSKSRIKVKLKPVHDKDAISSTDRSPYFREWLNGQ
ncbi:MAG: LytTR family DNA-binding domain-containing protein [Bacteroidetes bacterium]|jgi:DNA-binding LytR/AlgR family response regulator|nr:LytTR family DNA-binding domain-containing protein [Bacteroidota bacterium]